MLRVLIAGLILIFGPAGVFAADKPSSANLARFFETVVFGSEEKDLIKGSTVIKKWDGAIRITVSALAGKIIPKADGGREMKLSKRQPTAIEVKLIRKHLKSLFKITGLKAESAKKTGKKPNLFIKFVPHKTMMSPIHVPGVNPKILRRLGRAGTCYFLSADKRGRIVWATIVVNNQMSEREMDACLMEEMTQTLGLPNDSDLVKPSMFNNRAQPTAINRTDQILIRTLYDKRLTPGMPRGDAMKLAARLIAAWNKKLP